MPMVVPSSGEGNEEEKEKIITDEDVIYAEVMNDPRLLTLLLYLRKRPAPFNKLLRILEIPRSTFIKLLKRLQRTGLIEKCMGVDGRRRYYKLTKRGRRIASSCRDTILSTLKRHGSEYEDGRHVRIEKRKFNEILEEVFGISPSLFEDTFVWREHGYYDYLLRRG